jgi:hypothetical protein
MEGIEQAASPPAANNPKTSLRCMIRPPCVRCYMGRVMIGNRPPTGPDPALLPFGVSRFDASL